MRCQFCGWDNPEGKDTCEKCNKPLSAYEQSVDNIENGHDRKTDRMASGTGFSPRATVRESSLGVNPTVNEDNGNCPKCGYPLEKGTCPACGYTCSNDSHEEIAHDTILMDSRKTVRPHRKGDREGTFTLTPISEDTGMPEGEAIKFEGNKVILNRENTDPKNKTITSSSQATISFEDGKWSIVDNSEYKTTFVQASNNIVIGKGTLVLLGNQLYRFDA